jgi:hypothetical protein
MYTILFCSLSWERELRVFHEEKLGSFLHTPTVLNQERTALDKRKEKTDCTFELSHRSGTHRSLCLCGLHRSVDGLRWLLTWSSRRRIDRYKRITGGSHALLSSLPGSGSGSKRSRRSWMVFIYGWMDVVMNAWVNLPTAWSATLGSQFRRLADRVVAAASNSVC